MREVLEVMEMGSIFIVRVVTQVYTFTKSHRIVQLKWMYFIIRKLYLNKVDFLKKSLGIRNIMYVVIS